MESDCDQKRDGDEVGFLVWMHPPHGAQRFFQIQSLAMVGGNYISRGVSEDELRSWMRDYAGRNSADVDEVVVLLASQPGPESVIAVRPRRPSRDSHGNDL